MITEIKVMAALTFSSLASLGAFLAALTEGGVLTISTSIAGLLGTVFAGIMVYLTAKLNKMDKTGVDTHTLVNSNMGIQLKLAAELSRWKANEIAKRSDTVETIASEKAANAAEKLYLDHMAKQAVVDSGVKTS